MREVDFLIIGSGIAGDSVAYHLADHGSLAILEREDQPGYHSTGRSAALYAPSYGPPLMRIFTAESGAFLKGPPEGFSPYPLQRAGILARRDAGRDFRCAGRHQCRRCLGRWRRGPCGRPTDRPRAEAPHRHHL